MPLQRGRPRAPRGSRWYARGLVVWALAGSTLYVTGASAGTAATPEAAAQEAEATFRSAMEAWAYDEFWLLWDLGSTASRAALPRGDFTVRMRAGTTRPAAGKQVEAIDVTVQSPVLAVVYARFGLEDKRRPWAESAERPFFLLFEDGRWAVNLWDFIGLAYYFPFDYLPQTPLVAPPQRPPRPKAPMR